MACESISFRTWAVSTPCDENLVLPGRQGFWYFSGMPDDLRFRNRYRIPSARLASWDYRWAGVYSVTICTQGRVCCLGEIVAGEVVLSPEGRVAAEEWRKIPRVFPHVLLDEWIVMPDHMHGILTFQNRPLEKPSPESAGHLTTGSLGAVINEFKSKSTKRIRKDLKRPAFAWQTRFHDSILREPEDLDRLRAYIRANPARWQQRSGPAGHDDSDANTKGSAPR